MWEALGTAAVWICVLSALTTAGLVLWAALNGAGAALRIAREAIEEAQSVRAQWATEKIALQGALEAVQEEHRRAVSARNRAAALASKEAREQGSEEQQQQVRILTDRHAATEAARQRGLL